MQAKLSTDNLRKFLEIINQSIKIEHNISMADKTSFKCGGKADIYITPESPQELVLIKRAAQMSNTPLFLLGTGANILVSDKGIREPVVSTVHISNLDIDSELSTDTEVYIDADAGSTIDDLCDFAKDNSLGGLAFLAGLPSSVGGAVYMNARCYDNEISDVLHSVKYIDENGDLHLWLPKEGDFSYKKSPFQDKNWIILSAKFKVEPESSDQIEKEMQEKKSDRTEKGHYRYPCAGSIFKNNRDFGAPTGKIIENLNLKGNQIGDAQIAPFHGNIIINLGKAKSEEIEALIKKIEQKASDELKIKLEREIINVGDWKN